MTNKWDNIRATYLPDTTLHYLNGQYVVHIGVVIGDERFWLSPDDAESLGNRLIEQAGLARTGYEYDDEVEAETR